MASHQGIPQHLAIVVAVIRKGALRRAVVERTPLLVPPVHTVVARTIVIDVGVSGDYHTMVIVSSQDLIGPVHGNSAWTPLQHEDT